MRRAERTLARRENGNSRHRDFAIPQTEPDNFYYYIVLLPTTILNLYTITSLLLQLNSSSRLPLLLVRDSIAHDVLCSR